MAKHCLLHLKIWVNLKHQQEGGKKVEHASAWKQTSSTKTEHTYNLDALLLFRRSPKACLFHFVLFFEFPGCPGNHNDPPVSAPFITQS